MHVRGKLKDSKETKEKDNDKLADKRIAEKRLTDKPTKELEKRDTEKRVQREKITDKIRELSPGPTVGQGPRGGLLAEDEGVVGRAFIRPDERPDLG